jgi:hypothetical protein
VPAQTTDITSLSYDQLFVGLPANKPYLLWKWGERASEPELELAAQGLLAAKDSKAQLAHLRIFARRPFPLDVRALLPLAEIEQDRVGLVAIRALAQVEHPAVRDLACRLMDTQARWRGDVIELLSRNYESGDHITVLRWFDSEEDLKSLHSMGMDLIDFWKEHPDDETEIPML